MNKNRTIRRLLKEMKGKYIISMIFVFIFILIGAFADVSGSFMIQKLIDEYIPNIVATGVYNELLQGLLLMGLIYFVGGASIYLYNRMLISVSQGILKQIRDNMFAHLQALPIRYFDTHTHGNIMSHFTNDTDTLREFFSMSLPQMISSLFTIISVTVTMITLSLPLTGIVVVFMTVNILISRKVTTVASRYFKRQQKAIGELNGYIKEMINGQKVIKVFCHEEAVISEFNQRNDNLCKNAREANRLTSILFPLVMNISAIQYVAIALIGGYFALNNIGGVTLGSIAAFLTLSRTVSAPIGQISVQVNAVTMALAGAERIFKLMDEVKEKDEGYVTLVNVTYEDGKLIETKSRTGIWAWKYPHNDGTVTYTELKGDVVFKDVDFGYEEDKIVLNNISLYAKPGQKIAFVGSTGAGKTTITNLINRFYDIIDGEILYDGINIDKIKKADLRRSLGVVLQDTHLFTGTVADNIRYGKLDATEAEIKEAAVNANADSFISRLPEGYNTLLSGDGSNLSGGQRQLLAIARAAVANPPVMILDEATSSIDTRTEAIVQNGMDHLMEGRTVFVIAHRLSTVKNSQAIMVLEHGEIIERGNHDELINQQGRYYQLYTGIFKA